MPYRVLIVDDEPSSIRYIRTVIDSYLPEFQVIGEAYSGQEALDRFRGERYVDLIITDARMPGMDGIELAREARKRTGPVVPRVVVVSGYADFEYARGALSAGASEYLLKPLHIERTVEVLRLVAADLDGQYAQDRAEAFAHLMGGGDIPPDEAMRLFGSTQCAAAVVRFGNLPDARGVQALNVGSAPHSADFTLAPGRDEREWIALSARQDLEALRALAEAEAKGDAYTICYCAAACGWPELQQAVRDLIRTLDERLVMGKCQLIVVPARGEPPFTDLRASDMRKLDFFLQAGNLDALKELLFSLAVDWEQRALPQRVVEAHAFHITERALAASPQQEAKRLRTQGEVSELFQYARNAGELMSGLWDVLFQPIAGLQPRQPTDALAREILDYVREHSAEQLSIGAACVQFGISQTYLSRVLRKHAGTSFNEHLTACRMEAATRLIQEQPGAKLRDVAALCGYDDPSYFSKVFRQRVGMTPQQYAAQHGPD